MAISPINPEVLYAVVEAAEGDSGFYRSSNRGESWTKMSGYVSSSPQYYQEIVACPHKFDRVYSLDTYMMVSEDGGKTFERLGEADKHVDNHALVIDPNDADHLTIGCDGGIYESWDRGKTYDFKANLPITQVPTQSGFHAKSTGTEVLADLDLAGKIALVTGGYSGIGLETTRALVAKGVDVVVPVRSPQKAADALAELGPAVRSVPMDLADLASVKTFAQAMIDELPRLDFLINNAGIMACPEARVGPGWESQFGVNHMGHFALSTALLPLLTRTGNARVVALSSTAHKLSDIRWDDVQFTEDYNKWTAYGQAKTANALFANGLSRRGQDSGLLAFSVHPGGIFTPLQRHLPQEEMIALGWLDESGEPSELAKQGFKSPEQGCSTTLWAATSPLLAGKAGVYCENCDIAAPTEPGAMARYIGVNTHACDDESAERLWALSESLLAQA